MFHSRRFHKWSTIFWIFIGIPVNWFYQHEVWWVSFMSLYAIIISHAAAYQAARVEDKQNEQEETGRRNQ